uniref:Alpha-carbonic anhydrase domain-containing protein n=1 Tax=Timema cristinae TaxID=61476 RepID=A0A7R9CV13_TIMCR|nr:unnamed protein product [Timema cristinae]
MSGGAHEIVQLGGSSGRHDLDQLIDKFMHRPVHGSTSLPAPLNVLYCFMIMEGSRPRYGGPGIPAISSLRRNLLTSIILICFIYALQVVPLRVLRSRPGTSGPEQWTGLCNTGLKQSPVDLDKGVATRSYFHDLELFNYDKPTFINITNNGHTVRLDVEQPCTMSLAAGDLPGVYHLEQIHFHWPSEHTIQGNKWPLEVHLVHYDRKYPNVKEAVRHPQGLAVLAILYHVSDNNHACLVRILECIVCAMDPILLDIGRKVVLDTHSDNDSFGVDFAQ